MTQSALFRIMLGHSPIPTLSYLILSYLTLFYFCNTVSFIIVISSITFLKKLHFLLLLISRSFLPHSLLLHLIFEIIHYLSCLRLASWTADIFDISRHTVTDTSSGHASCSSSWGYGDHHAEQTNGSSIRIDMLPQGECWKTPYRLQ